MLKEILIGWAAFIAVSIFVLYRSNKNRSWCPYCAEYLDECHCDNESIAAARRREVWWHEEERRLGLK